jgi:hypothetical protein
MMNRKAGRVGRRLRLAFAVGFVAAALFHAVAAVRPDIGEPSPVWRHLLFVGINAGCAAGFVWPVRPLRTFIVGFGVLVAQQIYSHGTYAVACWRAEGRVDWASLVVLLMMPLAFGLLLPTWRRGRR